MDTDKEKTKELDLSFQKINWDEFNGSAYRVSGDQIRNLPISNLGNALAGLVPGFYSRQKSGGILNEAPNYWIRGLRTGTNSEGVLVLVDGQEREFGSLSPYEIGRGHCPERRQLPQLCMECEVQTVPYWLIHAKV